MQIQVSNNRIVIESLGNSAGESSYNQCKSELKSLRQFNDTVMLVRMMKY